MGQTEPGLVSIYEIRPGNGTVYAYMRDERCSAGVFCVAVRPYHPTPPTTALAEGARASRVQACRPCLQVSAADSAIVPLRGTMPAGRL